MSRRIFYLTGFMASGKSTIGPILANTIGWNYFDIDKEIEQREKKKISNIFLEDGETYFRKKETAVLKELSSGKKLIIALGGGTLVNHENMRIIKENGKLIYLKCSPDIAYKRLKYKRDRPILLSKNDEENNRESLTKKIEKLMEERIQYYAMADYCFNTDDDNIGTTVDSIARLIQQKK
jgi:shikimate kinase